MDFSISFSILDEALLSSFSRSKTGMLTDETFTQIRSNPRFKRLFLRIGTLGSSVVITENVPAKHEAIWYEESPIPNTGLLVTVLTASKPVSSKHPIIYASASLLEKTSSKIPGMQSTSS